MNFSPEMSLGSKLNTKADFPNPPYNVKLFSLLGIRAIMWEHKSLRPQTLPRPADGTWFETIFENLNLVLDIRDDKFHR